jgi:hypothetical protein
MERRSIRRQGFGVLLAGFLFGGASFVAVPHTWAQYGGLAQIEGADAATSMGAPAAGELSADGTCIPGAGTDAYATCDTQMPGDDPLAVDQPPTSSSFGNDGPFSGGE